MIRITPEISLDNSEIQEEFIQASGPGGQNVNKVATAVQLRFDVAGSRSLPDAVRSRLFTIARRQITEDGILVINARRFRSQIANREDAIDRLVSLIRRAAYKPRTRRRTTPTLSSKIKRLEAKRHRAATKRLRRSAAEQEYD